MSDDLGLLAAGSSLCSASGGVDNAYPSPRNAGVADTGVHDLVPCCRDAREAAEKAAAEQAAAEAKKQTRKQAKNFSLMSFGERGRHGLPT